MSGHDDNRFRKTDSARFSDYLGQYLDQNPYTHLTITRSGHSEQVSVIMILEDALLVVPAYGGTQEPELVPIAAITSIRPVTG